MRKVVRNIKHIVQDMDKPLLFVSIALFVFGLLNIVTASSSEAVTSEAPLYYYFYQQLKMLVAGFIVSIIIFCYDTKKYKPLALFGFVAILGLLLYLSMYGTDHRGSRNWIALPIIGRVQPSEFAKPVMIVCLALLFERFYARLRNKKINHYDMIGIILFVGLSYPAIVFLQKDFGTMFILFMIFFAMFLGSPILRIDKMKTFAFLFVLAIFAGLVLLSTKGYILSPEQMDRFNFFNPCNNYEEGGYQTCNGFIAINDGGAFGLGGGKSKQKYSYIPEPHTDSVFAIIVEEQGFFRSLIIFLGYIIILKRILSLSSRANTLRGRYMCLGVATYIFMHIFVNLGGLFGILPLTGVPNPFLSYGGSFTISLIISLAIVQRVHIETKRQKIKV